jgi:DNA-binding winged helix-turn-helix (wHTH) protein
MPISQRSVVFIAVILGITALLTVSFGALHLYRYLERTKAQFLERAALSAQIFAESIPLDQVDPAALDGGRLQGITQTFVQGDVLYAQVVRGGRILAEDRAHAALGLSLPVMRDFPGDLVLQEGKLRDGTPYLDVIRPFTGESPDLARSEINYVRVGLSLREISSDFRAEVLLTVAVGLGFLLVIVSIFTVTVLMQRGSPRRDVRRVRPRSSNDGRDREITATEGQIIAGPLRIHLPSREVWLRGERIDLSPKEYELLRLLAGEPGRVFSSREILERVWPEAHTATTKDVKQYIYLLRKKVESDPEHPQLIVTVRGFGYKLDAATVGAAVKTGEEEVGL